MKKLSYFLLAALSCGMIASCQVDEYEVVDAQVKSDVVLTAALDDEPATRTQLSPNANGGYKTIWSEGDAVSVFSSNTAHAKFVLKSGAGKTYADFEMKEGSLSFGVEDSNPFGIVGVYPYSLNTTVVKEGAVYAINTEIPAKQDFAVNSFAPNAAPMVGINPALNLYFKNVGTVVVLPLKGDVIIKSATLESKAHKIAGATVVTVDENDNIPVAEVTEAGVSLVEVSCGTGVQLSETEATNFFFVLAPGTYEANDLTFTFYDSCGNYYAAELPIDVTFERSMTNTFKAKVFEAQGTKDLDLYVRAKASAYMVADRIIPSLENVDVVAWAQNLKDMENTKAVLEEAVAYITLHNYKAAYYVLEGVPGFVRETMTFEAEGTFVQKVDYTGASYLVSMLEDIEKIEDIESLLKFFEDFEDLYEGSGVKNKLDNALGEIGNNLDTWIDQFIDALVSEPEVDNTDALTAYKNEIKENLDNTIKGVKASIAFIDGFNELLSSLGRGQYFLDERASLQAYLTAAESLYGIIDGLTDVEVIEEQVKLLPKVEIKITKLNINETINPVEWLSDAKDAYNDAIKDLITENETTIALAKAALKTAIGKLQGMSLVDLLEKAVETDENGELTTTAKFINYLFSQETFMNTVKDTLRTIVAEIEEASRENINSGNLTLKEAAIATAKTNAFIYARAEAVANIKADFDLTNQTNLNNLYAGPWGFFQKVLGWDKCIAAFDKLNILEVYDALIKLSEIVEGMIAYDKGSILYNIENIEDYQENVDWWVIEGVSSNN